MGLLSTLADTGFALARAVGLAPPSAPVPDRGRTRTVAIPGPYWDRDPAMLGNALTPQRLTRILSERNEGYLQAWTDLIDELVEHDPHLFSQVTIRAQSVVETELSVLPGEGSNQRAALRAAGACTELLTHWRAREGEGGAFEDWCSEWVWAKVYGRGLHELLWERDGGVIVPEGLSLLDTRRLSLACDADDPDPWALRIWDADGLAPTPFSGVYGRKVTDYHRDKFLAFEPRVRGSQKTREGLGSIVVWYELFRVWSWRELMALAEMVSRPPVIAYYAAGGAKAAAGTVTAPKMDGPRYAAPEERDAAGKVVYAKTGALRAVLPDTVRVEALKYGLPTTDPVPLLTSRECEALISKAVNGVANLSDLQPGARAAVEAQERTTYTFWRADCRSVERLVTRIFERFIRANPQRFGEGCPIPRLVAKTEDTKDTKAAGERIEKGRVLGLKIPKKWAHAALEIPEPKEGEEVLAPAPTPPTPGTEPGGTRHDPPHATPPKTPDVRASRVALAADATETGVIVCLVPPPEVAAALALPGGERAEDLHVTLAYLGNKASLDDFQRNMLVVVTETFGRWFAPVTGTFNGVARFASPDGTDAAVVTLDAPDLAPARERLVLALEALGMPVSREHGFVPHMTRAYVARGEPTPGGDTIAPTPVTFTSIALWSGASRVTFPLVTEVAKAAA